MKELTKEKIDAIIYENAELKRKNHALKDILKKIKEILDN